MEELSKILVMAHGSIWVSVVCYKENEAVFVFWDAVPEADYPASHSIDPFDENKWNKNCDGSWKK